MESPSNPCFHSLSRSQFPTNRRSYVPSTEPLSHTASGGLAQLQLCSIYVPLPGDSLPEAGYDEAVQVESARELKLFTPDLVILALPKGHTVVDPHVYSWRLSDSDLVVWRWSSWIILIIS